MLKNLLNPASLSGAIIFGLAFLLLAIITAAVIRHNARRVERHLSDVTALRFASAFAQVASYLLAFILYAHLVPELRNFGTALLAGASVASVVIGIAAQSTLGNLVAGLALVLYRPVRVGDRVEITAPKGPITARVESVSLGFTLLLTDDGDEVIVPNATMMSNTMVRHRKGT